MMRILLVVTLVFLSSSIEIIGVGLLGQKGWPIARAGEKLCRLQHHSGPTYCTMRAAPSGMVALRRHLEEALEAGVIQTSCSAQ
jgi:hypothetical protein